MDTDRAADSPQGDEGPSDEQVLGRSAEARAYDEVRRTNRRRLALLGLVTGGVMALIVLFCILLLLLLVPQ